MPVLNFKYVIFSFPYIYLSIGSDYLISMLTSIKCLQRKDVYCLPFG